MSNIDEALKGKDELTQLVFKRAAEAKRNVARWGLLGKAPDGDWARLQEDLRMCFEMVKAHVENERGGR